MSRQGAFAVDQVASRHLRDTAQESRAAVRFSDTCASPLAALCTQLGVLLPPRRHRGHPAKICSAFSFYHRLVSPACPQGQIQRRPRHLRAACPADQYRRQANRVGSRPAICGCAIPQWPRNRRACLAAQVYDSHSCQLLDIVASHLCHMLHIAAQTLFFAARIKMK